ncbi:MAG: hypothetical protein Hens3KO_02410 [Henriciella sp.]
MSNWMQQSQFGRSLSARATRWWKAKSPSARRAVHLRGLLGLGCFSAVVFGMPMISNLNIERQDDQQFRERNVRLAEAVSVGDALRSDDDASALLRHDWLRSVEYSLERDPDSALSRYAALERDRAALNGLQTFELSAMDKADDIVAESHCLAEAIYYEARSEQTSGQLAVAEVIANRVKDHRYPNSICDVVYQGATRTTGCQFTFTCDGAMAKKPTGWRWEKANTIASHVIMGLNETKTSGATHYHATYVNPVWNSGLVKTRQIGTHIFYRFPRGNEWAAASARQQARLASRRAGLATLTPAADASDAKASVIKTTAPASLEDQRPVVQRDLNAVQLQNITPASETIGPVEVVVPDHAASTSGASSAMTTAALAPVDTGALDN